MTDAALTDAEVDAAIHALRGESIPPGFMVDWCDRAIYRAGAARVGIAREPNGWMHNCQRDADCDAEPGAVISAKSKELWMALGPSGEKWVEHYTIPLYADAAREQPPQAARTETPVTAQMCGVCGCLFYENAYPMPEFAAKK